MMLNRKVVEAHRKKIIFIFYFLRPKPPNNPFLNYNILNLIHQSPNTMAPPPPLYEKYDGSFPVYHKSSAACVLFDHDFPIIV